jgi:hypothetical protein
VSLAIPETNLTQIHAASRWLEPADRLPFMQAIASELAGRDPDPGAVARATAKAFKLYFHPPLEADGQHEPKHLRKLDRPAA